MKFEQFTEASDKSRAMSAGVISGSKNPAAIKQAEAGEKQMKAVDNKARAENKLIDAKKKAKEDPSSVSNKELKDARDKVQLERKKVEQGQRALEESKKAIMSQATPPGKEMTKDQMNDAKAKQDALKEKTTKFFSEVAMSNKRKLEFLLNKIENFSELAEDDKVKESVTDLAEAVQNEENIEEVPKAAEKVIETVEGKCITFSDRCAAADIIKVLRSFGDDDISDIVKIGDQGKITQEDSKIPSEATMDDNKLNFSKSGKTPEFLIKAGNIIKAAAKEADVSIKNIAAAEKYLMVFPKPSDMVKYLKKTYKVKSKISRTKVSRAIKKFELIPEDNKTLYRSALYDFTNTGLGLATLYYAVPSAKSFFSGIKGLNKDLKDAADEIRSLNDDDTENMEFSESESTSSNPSERKSWLNRAWASIGRVWNGESSKKARKFCKENAAELTAAGLTTATVLSFLALNGKIGTLKERLRNTDDPEERADINKKLKNMKLYLTAMIMGTAVSGAIAARAQMKKHPKSWVSKKLKMKPFEHDFASYDFEDEIGETEESKDEVDPPPVEDADSKEDEELDKTTEDIKDAEVAIGPHKLTEFSKNLRRFINDPTNNVYKKKVLSQFSEAMSEAVFQANFADFNEVAEQPEAVSQVPPAAQAPAQVAQPAAVPGAEPPAPPTPAPAAPASAPEQAPAPESQAPVEQEAQVVDPNAAQPAAAPAPVDGQVVDPNAAAQPAPEQPQGDGTSESDIVIDKREVQNFSSADQDSYGSWMARLANI